MSILKKKQLTASVISATLQSYDLILTALLNFENASSGNHDNILIPTPQPQITRLQAYVQFYVMVRVKSVTFESIEAESMKWLEATNTAGIDAAMKHFIAAQSTLPNRNGIVRRTTARV